MSLWDSFKYIILCKINNDLKIKQIIYIQKTLGGSKTTTKRSVETEEKIPISTFFNHKEQKNEEEDEQLLDDKITRTERDFTVFDAVDIEEKVGDDENTTQGSKFPVFDAVPK